jgi:hypothetical protein
VPNSPFEVVFPNLPHGTIVTTLITPTSFDCGGFTRTASTMVEANRASIYHVNFGFGCMGCDVGISCNAGKTCNEYLCTDAFIPPALLGDYTPDWPNYSACKPPMSGPPVVMVGEGGSGFKPLVDGDVVKLIEGGQGGFHVWVALRVQNIGKSAVIKAKGTLPDLGATTPLLTGQYRFVEDTGSGYCEMWNFALQLDPFVNNPPNDLFGQPLGIDVTVTDEDGVTASGHRTVKIANSL